MDFVNILIAAKNGDVHAKEQLLEMYSPMLYREAVVEGAYDEDLMQELRIVLLHCIEKFFL